MKKTLLTVAAVGCGAIGAFFYLAALFFRVEPPELTGTEFMDMIIGVLLGVAVWGLFHAFELPHARPARAKLSLATGALVCLCAGASLVAWHRMQLAERERHGQAAVAATSARTNTPASRPPEEVH